MEVKIRGGQHISQLFSKNPREASDERDVVIIFPKLINSIIGSPKNCLTFRVQVHGICITCVTTLV